MRGRWRAGECLFCVWVLTVCVWQGAGAAGVAAALREEGSDSEDGRGFTVHVVDSRYDASKCMWVRMRHGVWHFEEHGVLVGNPRARQPFPKHRGSVEVRATKPLHVQREDGGDVEWHFGHFNGTCADGCDFVAAGYGDDSLLGENWVLKDAAAVRGACPCPLCANSCPHCRVFWADAH
eukprot:3152698-Rhodomonas_salina.1